MSHDLMTGVYNSWKHLEESVLLPSYSALNVLSLSLPLPLMGYNSQALFHIMGQSSCLSLWPLALLKNCMTTCPSSVVQTKTSSPASFKSPPPLITYSTISFVLSLVWICFLCKKLTRQLDLMKVHQPQTQFKPIVINIIYYNPHRLCKMHYRY